MKNSLKVLLITALFLAVFLIISLNNNNNHIKIGVITPLTGGAAYWGESAKVGFELAKEELKDRNLEVELIIEDGQLDPVVALNAAQKLVNVDKVDAIYSEFNPASVAVSSYLKDKNIFHLYDSAAESPLNEGPYNFKTYLDYKDACGDVAKYIKDNENVKKIGLLKMNLEHGDLCADGVKNVFGLENVIIEDYNPGVTDYRTILSKLNNQGVDAIFHASFQPETLASIRQMNELGISKLFVGLSETITSDTFDEYGNLIEGGIFFGLPEVEQELKDKFKIINKGEELSDYNAAALAYIHIIQIANAIEKCGNDNSCISNEISKSVPDERIGFKGFKNRIAEFENRIVKFEKGNWVKLN